MDELEGQHVIREWFTSRYREDKKWIKGSLKMGVNFICFKEAESDKGLIFPLDSITGLKMEKTWLVFNTLVILIGPKTHWFSSFSCTNPYVVFHTIEHFWQEGLLATTGLTGSKVRTKLGKEVLREAHDAQATLAAAASDLFNQGEQLEDAMDGVDRINRDLGIAESNLSNIESWLGRWRLKPVKPLPIKQTDDDVIEYSVLYATKSQDSQKPGYFSIQDSVIKISDSKHADVMSFKPNQVTSIHVATPWELVIRRRMIGESDVYACITSAKLIYVLNMLQPVYGRKLEYEDPSVMHRHVDRNHVNTQKLHSGQQKLQELLSNATQISQNHLKGLSSTNFDTTTFDENQPIGPQLRTLQQAQGVTDTEAEELSQVLKGLKSLATEIAPELGRQENLISELTQDVTDTRDRIDKNNKRMNRLL